MNTKCSIRFIWSLVSGLTLVVAGAQQVLAVSCGDVLTEDTTLDGDLSCSGTALVIGSDDITVDLNGHVLSGDGTGMGVDNSGGYDGVTIENGTIQDFEEGVLAQGADDLTLQGLAVIGAGGDMANGAVHVLDSERVTIKDTSISATTIFDGPNAMRFDSVSEAVVDNVDVKGGFFGVAFSSVDPFGSPTNGSIRKSSFAGNFIGALIANSTDATIEECTFTGADQGIRIGLTTVSPSGIRVRENELFGSVSGISVLSWPATGPGTAPALPISDVQIVENSIHDNSYEGMQMVNIHDSLVSENLIVGNRFVGIRVFITSSGNEISENTITGHLARGIALLGSALASGPTGNLIKENTCTGNGVLDMIHDATSTPNTWEENCFETSQGTDIGEPECKDDDGDGKSDGNKRHAAILVTPPVSWNPFLRGDSNADGAVDVSDPLFTLNFLFIGGSDLRCEDSADGNDDGAVDLSDAISTLKSLFLGGPSLPAPYPQTGLDPTPDQLGCEQGCSDRIDSECIEVYCIPRHFGD